MDTGEIMFASEKHGPEALRPVVVILDPGQHLVLSLWLSRSNGFRMKRRRISKDFWLGFNSIFLYRDGFGGKYHLSFLSFNDDPFKPTSVITIWIILSEV